LLSLDRPAVLSSGLLVIVKEEVVLLWLLLLLRRRLFRSMRLRGFLSLELAEVLKKGLSVLGKPHSDSSDHYKAIAEWLNPLP
jgi:hypothetical protein